MCFERHTHSLFISYFCEQFEFFDFSSIIINILFKNREIDMSTANKVKDIEKELKIAKEKAEVARYTKAEFIANINHDIRTPLTSMIGMAQFITEESQEYHIKEYARDIIKAGERLLDFASNILNVMQKDGSAVPQQPVDLRQIAASLEALLHPLLMRKKLKFHFICEEQIPPLLEGNPGLIYRILLNLLDNSIKFTHKGDITLSIKQIKTEDEKVFVNLTVSDTGIGIPEDKQKAIFEPFVTLSSYFQGVYKGMGLGLYTVRQLLEQLEGSIEVKSRLEEGSAFSVTLPLFCSRNIFFMNNLEMTTDDKFEYLPALEKLKVSYQGENDDRLSFSSSEKPRILVVEDDEIASKVISLQLKKCGCRVELTTSVENAVNKIKNADYDLIYIDIGLPDKTGYELIKIIRLWEKETGKQPVPVIALTAHVDDQIKQKCFAAGLRVVLKKPLSLTVIKQHLHQYFIKEKNNVILKKESGRDELINVFRKEIKDTLPVIQRQYHAGNWNELHFIVHKLNGSANYCADQRMKMALSELENALIAAQKRADLVSICFNVFLTELSSFVEQ
jgi:two-component system aerobic respiration control sensor histidine kinase ArcB